MEQHQKLAHHIVMAQYVALNAIGRNSLTLEDKIHNIKHHHAILIQDNNILSQGQQPDTQYTKWDITVTIPLDTSYVVLQY